DGVGSAVDQVAVRPYGIPRRVEVDLAQQAVQGLEAALDVADRIDSHTLSAQLSALGLAMRNTAMRAGNSSPSLLCMPQLPCMLPTGVSSRQPLVSVWQAPGWIRGCSPTTPSPRTSWILPLPSVMIQCRSSSWAARSPSLQMVMV